VLLVAPRVPQCKKFKHAGLVVDNNDNRQGHKRKDSTHNKAKKRGAKAAVPKRKGKKMQRGRRT
jgi:hypothetical protein